MNNESFEQFSMFNPKLVTSSVICWENSLSYSEELPRFIESLDSEPQSYSRISKWDKNIKTINMQSMKKSTGIENLDRRTLYIANSLAMAFEMCFEKYCQHLKLNQEDYHLELENISIIKGSQSETTDLDNGKDTDADFYIVAYLNDNYLDGEISFSTNSLPLKPKAASVLVIPKTDLSNYRSVDVQGTRYISYIAVNRRIK